MLIPKGLVLRRIFYTSMPSVRLEQHQFQAFQYTDINIHENSGWLRLPNAREHAFPAYFRKMLTSWIVNECDLSGSVYQLMAHKTLISIFMTILYLIGN